MRWIRKKWEDRPEWVQKAEILVEELWATYKSKELREAKVAQQKEVEEVKQKELEGLDAYLDKDIFDDDDIILNTATDELKDW